MFSSKNFIHIFVQTFKFGISSYRWWIDSFIETEWRIYASINKAIIGSDNGLLPVWQQAIIWTNAGTRFIQITVFKIGARPWTLAGKIWVSLASFPSLSYINFGKIVLQSSKFQILFLKLEL